MKLEWERQLKCHLKGTSCRKWEVGLKINDSENNWTPGAHLPHPGAKKHVYYHNIQTSFFAETAWPIKAKFDMKHL